MKRNKKIYLLSGVLVIISAATFLVNMQKEKKEKIKNSDKTILEIDSSKVTALSWEHNNEKLSFHKDDSWTYDDDENFPVDKEKIEDLLEPFQEFGVSFIIEDVEDFGQYGLDKPECTISLEADGKNYEILTGNFSTMDSERYVSIGDGNVYLVKNDPLEYFDATLKDVIKYDEVPDFEKVTDITFSGSSSLKIVYDENSTASYCKDDIYFSDSDGNYLPLDTSLVENYLQKISSLDLTDYVTYNASDKELKDYGLDNPTLSAAVNGNSDDKPFSFTLNIGLDKKENAYIRVGNSGIISKTSEDDYEILSDASYNSFRHREVITADSGDIKKIDVLLEDMTYTITAKEKDNEMVYYYNNKEIKPDDFTNALQNLKSDKFTNKTATGKKEIGLVIYLDNKNYPEINVDIYRYNGKNCLAVVDGKPLSLVKRSDVIDLAEAVNAVVLN